MKALLCNYLINKLSALLNDLRGNNFKKIRNQHNVHIDESVNFGAYTEINVVGYCNQLQIGSGVSTRKFCNFLLYPAATLIIGKDVFFNNSCSIYCLGHIEIGENVMFGEGVKIYDHNHSYNYEDLKLIVHKDKFKIGKVIIGKNSWIGSNVTILNNVEIGENVIIGANCLIYKSVPSNSIVKHVENLIITNRISTL